MAEKKSNSDYYAKAVFFALLGVGVVVGALVIVLRLSGSLR